MLALVLKELQSFLRPLAIAVIIIFLLMPLLRFFKEKKIPFSVTFLGIVMIFLLLILGIVFLLQHSVLEFDDNLSLHKEQLNNVVDLVFGKASQAKIAGKQLNLREVISPDKIEKSVIRGITLFLGFTGSILSEFLLVLLFIIFLIPSYEKLIKGLEENIINKSSKKFKNFTVRTEKSIKDYLITKTIISVSTGLITALILFIFQSKYIAILSFLVFALNFIPNIGSIIAVALAVIIYVLTYGLSINVLILLFVLSTIQFIFGNILEPKFTGNKLELSPIVILLSLFLWGWIWGIIGMFLAVPITAIIKISLESVDSTKKIAKSLE